MLNNIYIEIQRKTDNTHFYGALCSILEILQKRPTRKAVIKFMKAVFKYLQDC